MTAVIAGVEGLRPDLGRLFVTVGVFDGLHLGHAYLLEHLVAHARRLEARPAVITFDHHPDEVIVGSAPPLIIDPRERQERLAAAGVDVVVVQHFDEAVRRTPFDVFVGAIAERVDLAGFLMTPDSAFGHQRLGTPAAVGELGARLGYEVVVVPPLIVDGAAVSSSEIRRRIAAGDLDRAARLLGRPYAVVGEVRDGGSVGFEMPVALPPPGTYPVDGRLAVVSDDGVVRLRPAAIEGRVRLTFDVR